MDTITVLISATGGVWGEVLDALKFLGAIALPVLSAYLAYSFATRQSRQERKHAFLVQQLSELYSPLVAIRRRIRALSALRSEISDAANAAWREVVDQAPAVHPALTEHLDREFVSFEKLLEYDDTRLRSEILPLYEEMLQVFKLRFWLADTDTRQHFDALTRFVDVWRRHLEEALPPKVREQIVRSESELEPFYSHIEVTLDRLVARVREGKD